MYRLTATTASTTTIHEKGDFTGIRRFPDDWRHPRQSVDGIIQPSAVRFQREEARKNDRLGDDPHALEALTNLNVAFRSFMRPKGINPSCCQRPTTIPGWTPTFDADAFTDALSYMAPAFINSLTGSSSSQRTYSA